MCPGGGPVLGGGPGGVGQPGAAAPANEAAGGVSEDVSRAVFCGEYKTLHWFQSHTGEQLDCFCVRVLVVKSASAAASPHCAGLIHLSHLLMK